jgi:hypothetical protein
VLQYVPREKYFSRSARASVVVTRVNVRYPRQREYLNDSPGSSSSKLKKCFNFEKDVSPECSSSAACGAAPHFGK